MLQNSTHRLRAIEPEDVDSFQRWENDSSTWWLGATITPFSKATLIKFANGDHDLYRDKQLRLMLDASFKKKNIEDQPIIWNTVGAIDFYDYDIRNSRAGVGIVIDEKARRLGHAEEGLLLLRDYSFNFLGLHQLYAEVPVDHIESRSLFIKAGYIECEKRKDWIKGTNGWSDLILMQLVK